MFCSQATTTSPSKRRSWWRIWLLVAAGLLAACRNSCEGTPPQASRDATGIPTLEIPFRDNVTLSLDGQLDEPVWRTAADSGGFVRVDDGRKLIDAPLGGRALLFWDDAYLYVGLSVDDRDVRGGFPSDAVDPHLWESDTAEIMIDPDGDGDNRDYYEFQINPQNLVFDSRFDDYNQPRGGPQAPYGHQDYESGLESHVRILGTIDDASDRDQGYVVEARIPWRAFSLARHAPPRHGDEWRANFYAIEGNAGVAFSPIRGEGNFHRASRFGRLRFTRP